MSTDLLDKRETRIRRMFGNIAPRYDLLNHLLSLNIDRYFELFQIARLMMPLFSIVGGLTVFAWSRRLYGVWGGLLSLTLWVCCPNILAHARLITTDLGATAIGAARASANAGRLIAAGARALQRPIDRLDAVEQAAIAPSVVVVGPPAPVPASVAAPPEPWQPAPPRRTVSSIPVRLNHRITEASLDTRCSVCSRTTPRRRTRRTVQRTPAARRASPAS